MVSSFPRVMVNRNPIGRVNWPSLFVPLLKIALTILNHPGLLPIEPEQCNPGDGNFNRRQPGIMIIADQ
jgi:hypothetical protein